MLSLKHKNKIMVVCFTGNSGLTDYSVSLCRELLKLCSVLFVTAESYFKDKYKLDIPTIKIFRRTRQYPIDIFKFLFYVLNNKPEIILFESWIKYPMIEWFLVWIFKCVGIQTALTIHDLLPHYPKPWSKLILSAYYASFDKLIVHSENTANGLFGMGVKTSPLVVPHGVYDIFNFNNLSRNQILPLFPTVQADDFVVLFFGHIESRKGILEFLATSELLLKHPKIKFLVAGGNSLNDGLLEVFNTYRSKPNVVIHDKSIPMEQVQNYFTLANTVVLPYLEGTTSGVLKLAMAFGKPVIVTDVGDFSETLNDWPGLLIPVDDIPNDLSKAIMELRVNYETIMVKLNKNKTKYQWSEIAKQHFSYLSK